MAYSSTKTIQMKSSMAFIQSTSNWRKEKKLILNKYGDVLYDGLSALPKILVSCFVLWLFHLYQGFFLVVLQSENFSMTRFWFNWVVLQLRF